jgi:hypothetical protein
LVSAPLNSWRGVDAAHQIAAVHLQAFGKNKDMPQAARIELADQLFAGDKAAINAFNRRPCGGYMVVVERDGGEGQRLIANRVP